MVRPQREETVVVGSLHGSSLLSLHHKLQVLISHWWRNCGSYWTRKGYYIILTKQFPSLFDSYTEYQRHHRSTNKMVNVSRNGRKKKQKLPANVSDFTKYSESRVGSWSHILRGLLKEDEWIPRKQQYNLSFSFALNLQSQTDYVSPWRQTSSDILKSSLKKEIIFSCW